MWPLGLLFHVFIKFHLEMFNVHMMIASGFVKLDDLTSLIFMFSNFRIYRCTKVRDQGLEN
jgi:hypothetical protein